MKRRTLLKAITGLYALPHAAAALDLGAIVNWLGTEPAHKHDVHIKDGLQKTRDFDRSYDDDVFLATTEMPLLRAVVTRLERLQSLAGYANFNLLDMDTAIVYARNYSAVGEFSANELAFIEQVFSTDAKQYGFYGEKVLQNLTDRIPERDTIKLAGSGHYLFRGDALREYKRISRDIGRSIILTSGIRGVVKQLHLFLAKAVESNGNLSQASRSLAPPGHSFHGVGDFDVGKLGFGADNFTARFAETDEYKRLFDLGYVKIRYPVDNPFGVRYEPWHIKVV